MATADGGQVSWNSFVRGYQSQHNIPYQQALVEAGPGWKRFKEEMSYGKAKRNGNGGVSVSRKRKFPPHQEETVRRTKKGKKVPFGSNQKRAKAGVLEIPTDPESLKLFGEMLEKKEALEQEVSALRNINRHLDRETSKPQKKKGSKPRMPTAKEVPIGYYERSDNPTPYKKRKETSYSEEEARSEEDGYHSSDDEEMQDSQ